MVIFGRDLMTIQMPHSLQEKIADLPHRPGVYMMKDARSEVIYVGKAKDLRLRVRSYWQEGRRERRLISERIGQVEDVAVVVTASEKEAFLLESNLIQQMRPKYNVNFRDDKSFVSIKIDMTEPWPRPIVTRRLDEPEAMYFGPYASAKAARRTLRTLGDVFPLRKCSIRECRARRRPCLYGEMGKCAAPCCHGISEEQYRDLVDQVVMFLKGDAEELLKRLGAEMEQAARNLDFELAARLRDRIGAVRQTVESQRVAESAGDVDRDVFGICALDRYVCVAALFVRDGNVRDVASYRFPAALDSREEIFRCFLGQFYRANRFVPEEVLAPVETEDAELLESWLSEKKGRRVRILHPKRGQKRRLVEMANQNARQAERAATAGVQRRRLEMESLQRILDLDAPPRSVECFDISALQGREAVGSMVVFREGEPDKSSYRRYKIRGVEGQDDPGMMRQALRRRYRKVKEGDAEAPDLILVDGGRGQLGAALEALEELGIRPAAVAALAKARVEDGRQVKAERVYLPGGDEPIEVPKDTYGFRLITRIRDEAHRFAIQYHRLLRRKSATRSPLEDVDGIGPKKARRLVEHFGGLNKIRRASIEELRTVPGISERLARAIAARLERTE